MKWPLEGACSVYKFRRREWFSYTDINSRAAGVSCRKCMLNCCLYLTTSSFYRLLSCSYFILLYFSPLFPAMTSEFAFITGAAGGVGKAMATSLASKGTKVFIADRDAVGAAATATELNGEYSVVDAADWKSQAAAFQRAVDLFGRVDYVLAVAGVGENQWMPAADSGSGFQKPDLSVIDINVTGMLYTVSLAVQQFRRQPPNAHGFRGKGKYAPSNLVLRSVSILTFYSDRHWIRVWHLLLPWSSDLHDFEACSDWIGTLLGQGSIIGRYHAELH